MPIPFSTGLAYAIFERALDEEIGLAIGFEDDTDVIAFRNRLYEARKTFPDPRICEFQFAALKDPDEIWLLPPSLDLKDLEPRT